MEDEPEDGILSVIVGSLKHYKIQYFPLNINYTFFLVLKQLQWSQFFCVIHLNGISSYSDATLSVNRGLSISLRNTMFNNILLDYEDIHKCILFKFAVIMVVLIFLLVTLNYSQAYFQFCCKLLHSPLAILANEIYRFIETKIRFVAQVIFNVKFKKRTENCK